MLRLNLAREPSWLDLGHGVRIRVEPLTTALMVAARSDPAVRGLPEETGDDEIAVVFGKALATRAILDWEGVGDADGNPVPVTPDGIAALLDNWPLFERFQMGYVAKGLELEAEKTAPRPRRLGLRRGRSLLRGVPRAVPGLPANPERAADMGGLASLGSCRAPRGPDPRGARRGFGMGHGCCTRDGRRVGRRSPGRRRILAGDRDRHGAASQRTDGQ